MNDLGALLRQARESMGVTLAQAEQETHIRQAYLQALEENRRDALPDLVYVRGLVTNYSRYLGVDEALAKELLQSTYGRPENESHSIASYQPLSEPLHLPKRGWATALVVLLLVAVIAGLAWWFWPDLKPWRDWLFSGGPARLTQRSLARFTPTQRPESATATFTVAEAATAYALPTTEPMAAQENSGVSEATATVALPTSAALPLPTPTTRPSPTPVVLPTATATRETGIHVNVAITSAAWLRVTADGKIVYEGTLQPGEKKDWVAQQTLEVLSGNAGGTLLTVNGSQPAPMGGPGVVVRKLWLVKGDSIVETTPQP